MNAIASTPGPKFVELDDTFTSCIISTPGTYDLSDTTWTAHERPSVTLAWHVNTFFTFGSMVIGPGATFENTSTTTIPCTAGHRALLILNGGGVLGNVSQPLITVGTSSASSLSVVADLNAGIGGGVFPVFSVNGAGALLLILSGLSQLSATAFSGDGAAIVQFSSDCAIDFSQSGFDVTFEQQSGASDFVWQPGGTAGGNVYTTWPELYGAISAIQGLRRIVVDPSLGSATVPAGTYALGNTAWYTADGIDGAVVTFASGAHVTTGLGVVYIYQGVTFAAGGTGLGDAVFDSPNGAILIYDGFIQGSSFGTPLVHATGGGWAIVVFSGQVGDGTHQAVVVDSTFTLTIEMNAQSVIEASALNGAGEVDVFYDSSSRVSTSQPGLGTLGNFKQSNATEEAYNAATVANWSGTNPSSVANALDRIAAKIGPIA